jgi:two-component system sensor histidine kinase UhpB
MTDAALAALTGFGTLEPEHLARLVDQLPVLLWSTDEELQITSRRGGGLALLGPPPRADEGLRVGEDVENPDDAARALAAHQAALHGHPTAYEVTFRGRTFSARVEPLRDGEDRVCGVVGLAFDVTERRRAEDALRENETRLRTIIESEPQRKLAEQALGESEERLQLVTRATNDAVWDWDLVTNAVWWGRGFESLFWYTRDEIEPGIESWYNRLHPDDAERVIAGIRAAIDGGSPSWSSEYRFRRRDGSYADVYDRGYVIHDPQTRTPIRMVGSMMDISERKRSQEQLQASRAALRLLAARHQEVREHERTRIAREIHDSLGQALTALKLQLVATHEAVTADGPGIADRLAEAAGMADDLVKSVRRIATELRPPILDQLGLPAAVEWLAQDFSRRTGIACTAAMHPIDGAINGELATALFRIVQESLTNVSRHAGAKSAAIELGVKCDCVTLEINDDGVGITESGVTGPGSLGILGMRERAAAMGGVLEVVPRIGGGTRVAAWFPPVHGARVRKPRGK